MGEPDDHEPGHKEEPDGNIAAMDNMTPEMEEDAIKWGEEAMEKFEDIDKIQEYIRKKFTEKYLSKKPSVTGWMTKRGKIIRNWKRRWFILRGFFLEYYRVQIGEGAKPTDKDCVPMGVVDLREAEFSRGAKGGRRCVIIKNKIRTWYLQCDGDAAELAWFEALQASSKGKDISITHHEVTKEVDSFIPKESKRDSL